MAKKIIVAVTVTGADDSIRPEELIPIAKYHPFVEFGILLSKKQQGTKRYPSREWLEELYIVWKEENLALSGHLCGEWVRDLCLGKPNFFKEFGDAWEMFKRLQLNFHAEKHKFRPTEFGATLRKYFLNGQVIFQMDGVNREIFELMNGRWGISAHTLFDLSGGTGILPKEWPKQLHGKYCGYAGGLSPNNLQGELEKISGVVTGPIWIDAETRLRSANDTVFDLEKVCRFLEAADPWVL